MSPYEKKGLWFTRVTLPDGRSRVVSCGTSDKTTAKAVERMLGTLKSRRQWAALALIVEKKTSLPKLFDAYELGLLPAFIATLTDTDLDPLVTEWKTAGANATYLRQVRRLVTAGHRFPASTFTRKTISAFLAGLPVSGSTKNRYRAALSVFAGWLVEREVIAFNPITGGGVKGQKENPPRDRWLAPGRAMAVCDAAPQPYRGLFALLYGAGVEIAPALSVTIADCDREAKTVHIRGGKNAWRNRVVVVEAWAWDRIEPLLAGLPLAPLFPGVTYDRAYWAHHNALDALELTGFTMHDARHSYAVNALRAGLRPEVVARQLGHKDATLVLKVYGKYVPTLSDYQPSARRSATSGATSARGER